MKKITVILIAVCALLSGCLTSHNNDSLQSSAETTSEVPYSSESNTESNTENTDNDTFDPDATHISVIRAEDIDPNARLNHLPNLIDTGIPNTVYEAYKEFTSSKNHSKTALFRLHVNDVWSWSDYYWDYNYWHEEIPTDPEYYLIRNGVTIIDVSLTQILFIEGKPYEEFDSDKYDSLIGKNLQLSAGTYWYPDENDGKQVKAVSPYAKYVPQKGSDIIARIDYGMSWYEEPVDSAEDMYNELTKVAGYYKDPYAVSLREVRDLKLNNSIDGKTQTEIYLYEFFPDKRMDGTVIEDWYSFLDYLRYLDDYYSENYKNGTFDKPIGCPEG